VFLQTVEHVRDPEAVLRRLAALLAPGGTAYISTPNVLRLAAPGASKSDNPWHLREYRAEEFEALCRRAFAEVDLLGLHHARKLRVHDLALRLGWDRVHAALGVSRLFYDRFTAAISARDFVLRPARARERTAGRRRRAGAACAPAIAPARWGARATAIERALDFVAVCRGALPGPGGGGCGRGAGAA